MGLGTFVAGAIVGIFGVTMIPIPAAASDVIRDQIPWKTINQIILEKIIQAAQLVLEKSSEATV